MPELEPAHPWENRTLDEADEDRWHYGDYWGECSDSDTENQNAELSAGMEFVSYLLKLLFQSVLSAHVFCIIMFLAGKAGIREAVEWGLPPGKSTGNYAKKVRTKLGWSGSGKKKFLFMQVPSQGKHAIERNITTVAVIPGHEQLVEDVEGIEASKSILAEKKRASDLPLCYTEHPIVQGAQPGELVIPIGVYLDGVPYSQTDSVIGMWLINLLDQRRYLMALVRKRNLCMCGCRGWCSFYGFFCMIHWVLQALARGQFPDDRFDGAWQPSDVVRSEKSGRPFNFKCACLYVKGDWSELGVTLGFPTWKDALRPCFCCNASHDTLYSTLGMSIDRLTWLVNQDDDYFESCSRCEVVVTLTGRGALLAVLAKLRYDKRKSGSHGRALVQSIQVGPY